MDKNPRSRELSKRRVIRVVWSWSWCFRESLNYRLTRRKRWSWLCSKTSSRRVCKRSPFQGKSGRSESTVQSGRHEHGSLRSEWRLPLLGLSPDRSLPQYPQCKCAPRKSPKGRGVCHSPIKFSKILTQVCARIRINFCRDRRLDNRSWGFRF